MMNSIARSVSVAMVMTALGALWLSPGHASARPAAGSQTKQVLVNPFTVSGNSVAPGYHVAGRGHANCWTHSIALTRVNAWRCMSGNFIYDPCFQANNHSHKVGCPIGLHSPYKIKIFSTKQSLPFGDLSPPYPVWAVKLANGAYCTRLTGTVLSWHGHYQNYSCDRKGYWAWDNVKKAAQPWVILTGYGNHPNLVPTSIKTAFR